MPEYIHEGQYKEIMYKGKRYAIGKENGKIVCYELHQIKTRNFLFGMQLANEALVTIKPNKCTEMIKIEFKKEDVWIGVYWKRSIHECVRYVVDSPIYSQIKVLDIWICIIPCFPIHITKSSE